uniref:Putative radical SAM superfamily protein n=1 Tax=viral metagenome TaxID=1070528 RepID=A0A6M3L7H6_9ZZZZ
MDQESIYTSTGIKFIHHTANIDVFKNSGVLLPISLQIAPTSRCNLNCVFCSNVNRGKDENLNPIDIADVLFNLRCLGLKSVEWTGGGDPTLYPDIEEVVLCAKEFELKQGFITNGIKLYDLDQKTLDTFTWVRISMNCLDYVDSIDIPKIRGILGFSYVWNEKSIFTGTIKKINEYVEKYDPKYVRIVPNCQSTVQEQIENNKVLSKFVENLGPPYFYQVKSFLRPDRCWWAYVKPFILHDGWVYPCSSVVLNSEADRSFHEKYRWVKTSELYKVYKTPSKPVSSQGCDHCVFLKQNDMIESLYNSDGMEDFV